MAVTAPASLQKIRAEFGSRSLISTVTFDSGSGTATAPSNTSIARIKLWGGGGGGAYYLSSQYAVVPGGGGGFVMVDVPISAGQTISYSVGGGGAAASGNFSVAGNGGSSSATVGSTTYTAGGGQGGNASGSPGPPNTLVQGAGGTASGGDVNENGASGIQYYIGGAAGGRYYGGGDYQAYVAGNAPGGGGSALPDILFGPTSITPYPGAAGRVQIDWLSVSSSNNLSSFVRGGSFVPNNGLFSGISATTNGLAISQFLNKSKTIISLPSNWGFAGYDIYIWASNEGADASSVIEVLSNGFINYWYYYLLCGDPTVREYAYSGLGESIVYGRWLEQGSTSGVYVRLDENSSSGNAISGPALNTNHLLDSDRVWRLCQNYVGGVGVTSTFDGVLSLRDASNNVIASKTIYLRADTSDPPPSS